MTMIQALCGRCFAIAVIRGLAISRTACRLFVSLLHTWRDLIVLTLVKTGPIEFDQFWTLYPRRVAKKDAEKAWSKLSQDQQALAIAALPAHRKAWSGKEMEFLPYPASWIRGERWHDEIVISLSLADLERAHPALRGETTEQWHARIRALR